MSLCSRLVQELDYLAVVFQLHATEVKKDSEEDKIKALQQQKEEKKRYAAPIALIGSQPLWEYFSRITSRHLNSFSLGHCALAHIQCHQYGCSCQKVPLLIK